MSQGQGIAFEGPGPYALPIAQRTIATANKDNGVDVTFYILTNAHATQTSPVRIPMTADGALTLAGQLADAAAKATAK